MNEDEVTSAYIIAGKGHPFSAVRLLSIFVYAGYQASMAVNGVMTYIDDIVDAEIVWRMTQETAENEMIQEMNVLIDEVEGTDGSR
jgi:hypothetical protein